MKHRTLKIAGLILSCVTISACDTGFEEPTEASLSSGSADFTTFVTLGGSLTAGYADNALYLTGQTNSYPNILAQQFTKVGGGEFKQPLVSDNLGGLLFGGALNADFGNRLVLNTATTPPSPEPLLSDSAATTEVIGSGLNGSTFNNMGVPGSKSFHLLAEGYGNQAGLALGAANPYFVRFASMPNSTMIADAAAQQPSFVVLWIGNNDVLSFATSGGDGEDQLGNLDPSSYGANDITDPNVFANVYAGLVGAFKQANPDVKGLLVNLPDVSSIPFFTTVPFNPVPLDQPTADALNAAYAPYNGGVAQILGATDAAQVTQRTINFSAGQNAVVILDEGLTDLTSFNPALLNLRQATADDLLLLSTSSVIGELVNPLDDPANPAAPRWGISAPLLDEHVLIHSEIEAVNAATQAFNATIKGAADAEDNLTFFDVAQIMVELNDTGINYGSGSIQSTYGSGGAFSLDGVHPTARGYAVIANRMIDAINADFNASVPTVDPGAHTTVFVKIP